MSVRKFLGRIRRGTLSAVNRREFVLPGSEPVVSFTFDDFPRSALHEGGQILEQYDVRGTFYAAMGLMGKCNELGPHFTSDDLELLLRDGHELGSHTFHHLSCRSSSLRDFEVDVRKGRESTERITGLDQPHHFSYPYGHVTSRAKSRIGVQMSSSRGTAPGINESPVDLNLLRANSLYSSSLDLTSVERLLIRNKNRHGWLIFYTHDVSEQPSPFGCKPAEFEHVLQLAIKHCKVLPVGQVLSNASSIVKPSSVAMASDKGV